MSKIIRAILTLALIYGAYTETGVFTALSLLLIFVAIELQGWLTQRAPDVCNASDCKEPAVNAGLCEKHSF